MSLSRQATRRTFAAAALCALVLTALAPPLTARAAERVVPAITAKNLLKRAVDIPSGLAGERNLLILAFVREQQADVDTWLGPLAGVAAETPGFDYYELPTVGPFTAFGRWFLDNAMRSGIEDREQRRRTITIYAPKETLMSALGNPPEDRIHSYLVDRDGRVLWSEEGRASEEKLAALRAALADN